MTARVAELVHRIPIANPVDFDGARPAVRNKTSDEDRGTYPKLAK